MADPWTGCTRCHQPHVHGCHAHVRRCNPCGNSVGKTDATCRKCKSDDIDDFAPCRGYALRDMTVCRKHGARSPQALAARERRDQFAIALAAADTFGMPREIDPRAALEEELWRTAGVISFYELIIRSDEHDALKQHTYDDDGRRWERPSVWVELLERERRHYVTVAKEAARAGIEERRVQMSEQVAETIVAFTRALLADLGRDDPEGHEIAARRLRSIEGGAAA